MSSVFLDDMKIEEFEYLAVLGMGIHCDVFWKQVLKGALKSFGFLCRCKSYVPCYDLCTTHFLKFLKKI